MKIVKASWRVEEEQSVTKKIEKIARICYKSEDHIGEGTDIAMIKKLIEKRHMAMLEHSDLCYIVDRHLWEFLHNQALRLESAGTYKCYLRFTDIMNCVVSGNIRAWIEFFDATANDLHEDFVKTVCADTGIPGLADEYLTDNKFSCNFPSEIQKVIEPYYGQLTSEECMIHQTFTLVFITDRGVSHELVRMRPCSFAQESTRYCDYGKDKFNREITVILPPSVEALKGTELYATWEQAMSAAEDAYIKLTDKKVPAQIARGALPNNVKTEIACTANLTEWYHIFALRACNTTGPAHPQMLEVMRPACEWAQQKYPYAFEGLQIAWD